MCGMTRADDVTHAINLGVDALGFIFYSQSPRHVTLESARLLLKDIPPFVTTVAVLVNPEYAFVQQLLEELPIQLLQFHGDESPEYCRQFNKPFIKAIHPKNSMEIRNEMDKYNQACALLLDTPTEKGRGGTGLTFDWNLIPTDLTKPYILAGGLNQYNVLDACKVNPYAVDVSSGIEKEPGIKDHLKMSQFIKALWGIK